MDKIFSTPMITDSKSGSYVPVEGPAQSHRHGIGRYAREAYGSKESCRECMQYDRRLEEARRAMRTED
jgi:hypothetical protein